MFCSNVSKISSNNVLIRTLNNVHNLHCGSHCIRTMPALAANNWTKQENTGAGWSSIQTRCKFYHMIPQSSLLQEIWIGTHQRNLHGNNSDSRSSRQVRKAPFYKRYPSSYFVRLRKLRLTIRQVLQRNAKSERKRLSQARMGEGMRRGMDRMRDMVHVRGHLRPTEENIFTIPNVLSTLRLTLSPLLGYLVVTEQYFLATGLFVFTGVTDLLDGYIARNFKNQKSVLGSIIDPLADKCLISILTISLTISSLIPVPLTILIIARDVGLVGAASYMRYKSLQPPITLTRYFDVSHATVQLKPTFISKVNTAVQLILVGVTLPAPIFHYVDHVSLQYLWGLTAATTVLSGLSYVFSKNTVEFLKSSRKT